MRRTEVTHSLLDHFKRAWGMVTRAVEDSPEEEWLQGEDRKNAATTAFQVHESEDARLGLNRDMIPIKSGHNTN